MVKVGFAAPPVTKTALPTMYRFGDPWSRRSPSVTLRAGSWPIRHVPMWW
jgi:hypothetical protein